MKVVINTCYGGFGLSVKALRWLQAKKSSALTVTPEDEYFASKDTEDERANHAKMCELLRSGGCLVAFDSHDEKLRSHPDVVGVVEALGHAADQRTGKLAIVEIPDGMDYVIDEYDGVESIHEAHRSWR